VGLFWYIRSVCGVYRSLLSCLPYFCCLLVCDHEDLSHIGLFCGSLFVSIGLLVAYVGLFYGSLLTRLLCLCFLFVGENVLHIGLFCGSVLMYTGLF